MIWHYKIYPNPSSEFLHSHKSQNFKPGIMCTMHTFGRDLKWNPHIHVLCTECGAGNTEVFRIIRHINFNLKKKFFLEEASLLMSFFLLYFYSK